MPDQPSKESLACGHPKSCERIIQRGCDVCPECVHTICGWCEQVNLLRQQNAALVEALRACIETIDDFLYQEYSVDDRHDLEESGVPDEWKKSLILGRELLPPYAPADAPEKEPRRG